ncbi:MAG: AcrR family transcriptional regulator, partial [Sphingobacteriales bacterium]
AQVSEGLIFKHFGNKEGLLQGIVEWGMADAKKEVERLSALSQPLEVIHGALDFVLTAIKTQPEFWLTLMSLKHQSPEIAERFHDNEMMGSLHASLQKAFAELNYQNPEMEAQFVIMLMGALFKELSNSSAPEREQFIKLIKTKYTEK